MAVAGATMPAQHIRKRNGRIYIAHSENRPVTVLVDDPEAAEALLLSTGDVLDTRTHEKRIRTAHGA